MLVLFETSAGFAIFKLVDEQKLSKVENLFEDFETPQKASKVVQLKDFAKYADSAEALQGTVALNEGQLCKPLKKILKSVYAKEAHEKLAVWDAKLGNTIKEKIGMQCVSNTNVAELMRCIKSQIESLIPGVQEKELAAMSLGLGHNLARYKLKFSPDKVDTMIVQAISLLDDIDKELNNYVMRAREWYGWHFPELGKILTDNTAYVSTIMTMGTRDKACTTDFSDVLPEDLEAAVKEAAEVSMGSEITPDDILNINCLCEQIKEMSDYRAQLNEYLTNRMAAIAPNLTVLVGELVGARLIAHAGSLINLAKHPASTIQILGAEKALFRALKTRHATPKFGMLYHAQLVSQTSMKNKGKVSRMLAAKAALACRYDALGEETTTEMGINNRAKLTSKVNMIENGFTDRLSGKGKSMARFEKYEGPSEVKQYNVAADSTLVSSSKRKYDESFELPASKKVKVEGDEAIPEPTSAKKKKTKVTPVKSEPEELQEEPTPPKKKKKKSKAMETEEIKTEPVEEAEQSSSEKKKKKKKKDKKQES